MSSPTSSTPSRRLSLDTWAVLLALLAALLVRIGVINQVPW